MPTLPAAVPKSSILNAQICSLDTAFWSLWSVGKVQISDLAYVDLHSWATGFEMFDWLMLEEAIWPKYFRKTMGLGI